LECGEKKQSTDVIMPKVSRPCYATNHERSCHISPVKVPDTRSLSPNSSTESFDVDLTKMDNGEEAKCNNQDDFAVPTCLPPKKQLKPRRYIPSENLSIPDTGNMTNGESDPQFSETQSEFDCKLLSGALYHKGEIFRKSESHCQR
jgi:hypothetical protein